MNAVTKLSTVQMVIINTLIEFDANKYIIDAHHYNGTPESGGNLWIGNQIYLQLPDDYGKTGELANTLAKKTDRFLKNYPDEIEDATWEIITFEKGSKMAINKFKDITDRIMHIDIDITFKKSITKY